MHKHLPTRSARCVRISPLLREHACPSSSPGADSWVHRQHSTHCHDAPETWGEEGTLPVGATVNWGPEWSSCVSRWHGRSQQPQEVTPGPSQKSTYMFENEGSKACFRRSDNVIQVFGTAAVLCVGIYPVWWPPAGGATGHRSWVSVSEPATCPGLGPGLISGNKDSGVPRGLYALINLAPSPLG